MNQWSNAVDGEKVSTCYSYSDSVVHFLPKHGPTCTNCQFADDMKYYRFCSAGPFSSSSAVPFICNMRNLRLCVVHRKKKARNPFVWLIPSDLTCSLCLFPTWQQGDSRRGLHRQQSGIRVHMPSWSFGLHTKLTPRPPHKRKKVSAAVII